MEFFRTNKKRWLIPIALLLIGVIISSIMIMDFYSEVNGLKTITVNIETVKKDVNAQHLTYEVSYRFEVDGEQYSGRGKVYDTPITLTSTVEVHYNPQNPGENMTELPRLEFSNFIPAIIGLALCGILNIIFICQKLFLLKFKKKVAME